MGWEVSHLYWHRGQCLRHLTNAILIIDEAQRLSFELLEEIRLLSNMETGDEKLINIFLVGQPELNEKLSKPQCLPLLQRISMCYHIPPLDLKGTRGYMATRLRLAGAPKGHEIFSKSAVEAIHQHSRGYPRVINILADNALLLGYSRGTKPITPHMVKQCYEDMSLESSFPRDGRKMPEPYETRKIDRAPGPYWKLAAVLCFFIALVAFGMTQTGRSLLRQLFGLKQASYQSTSDTHTPAQILMEKEEILETDDSASRNQMGVQSPPGMQPEQKGTETIEIGKPGGSMERMSTLQEQDKGSFTAVVVEEGVMCRDVLHRRPLVVGNSFKASVGKLYCFTKIVAAQSPIEITHVWYFGNSKMAKVNLPVECSSWRTYSSKTIHPQDIGDWHVEVLGPEGSVLWSVQFKITP